MNQQKVLHVIPENSKIESSDNYSVLMELERLLNGKIKVILNSLAHSIVVTVSTMINALQNS